MKNIDTVQPVAWLYEDTLPPEYPYDLMYPYSKVDGVRMFPVFMPIHAAGPRELLDALRRTTAQAIANWEKT